MKVSKIFLENYKINKIFLKKKLHRIVIKMPYKTTVSKKFQTTKPAKLRDEINIKHSENLLRKQNGNEVVRKIEQLTFKDMIGRYTSKEPFDSVKLKKKTSRGC